MRRQSTDEVMVRIRAARAATPGGVLAFDGDGTLWSGDVGEDFFLAVADEGVLAPEAMEALRRAAATAGIDGSGDARTLLRRVFVAAEEHRFPEELVYAVTAWLCAGWHRSDIASFVRGVLSRAKVPARLQRESVRLLEWARADGIDVRVVSASPQHVVEEAAAYLGLDPHHVVAVRAVFAGDVMRPDVQRPMPYGEGKVSALRADIGDRPLYAAFGDNAFDVPLLQAAGVPVAVRPKARLRAREAEIPDAVELVPE